MAEQTEVIILDKESPSNKDSFVGEAAIDIEGLAKAVKLSNQGTTPENFAFGKQMLAEIDLHSMKMKELGDIQIPVSLLVINIWIYPKFLCQKSHMVFITILLWQDVTRLKEISQQAPYGTGNNNYVDPLIRKAMQIDRSEIISTTPVDLCLASHVVHLLDLPSTDLMDIEVKLDQLILYESGGHYKRDLDSKKEPCM